MGVPTNGLVLPPPHPLQYLTPLAPAIRCSSCEWVVHQLFCLHTLYLPRESRAVARGNECTQLFTELLCHCLLGLLAATAEVPFHDQVLLDKQVCLSEWQALLRCCLFHGKLHTQLVLGADPMHHAHWVRPTP